LRLRRKKFQEKLQEVDGELQVVAKEWDAAVDANANEAGRKSVMAKLNELLKSPAPIFGNLVVNVQKRIAVAQAFRPEGFLVGWLGRMG